MMSVSLYGGMYSTPFLSLDICLQNGYYVSDDGDNGDDSDVAMIKILMIDN